MLWRPKNQNRGCNGFAWSVWRPNGIIHAVSHLLDLFRLIELDTKDYMHCSKKDDGTLELEVNENFDKSMKILKSCSTPNFAQILKCGVRTTSSPRRVTIQIFRVIIKNSRLMRRGKIHRMNIWNNHGSNSTLCRWTDSTLYLNSSTRGILHRHPHNSSHNSPKCNYTKYPNLLCKAKSKKDEARNHHCHCSCPLHRLCQR